MTYVEGFVLAVPAANKETYRAMALEAVALFKEFGATRLVENWGDDIPDGEINGFKRAAKAKPDEVVMFSWIEYPDRAARDAANQKLHSDPRTKDGPPKEMPFDGQRMFFAGFAPIVEHKTDGKPGYVDGSLVAVPTARKEEYRAWAEKAAAALRAEGALRVVEAWGDDVPDGKVTDFKRAVQARPDETVVYCWIEWPSKDIRDVAWQKLQSSGRFKAEDTPFESARRVYGGFMPIVDG